MHARRKNRYSTLRFKVRSPSNPRSRAYSTGHARISAFQRSIIETVCAFNPLSDELPYNKNVAVALKQANVFYNYKSPINNEFT